MPRSERLYLTDIIEAARTIQRFVGDRSHDEFDRDDVLRHAVLYLLTVIGEASSRLPNELKDRHPTVEWADIVGFRNRAIHAYFAVDWDIVWIAATEDAPHLAGQIADVLAREYPTTDQPEDETE